MRLVINVTTASDDGATEYLSTSFSYNEYFEIGEIENRLNEFVEKTKEEIPESKGELDEDLSEME